MAKNSLTLSVGKMNELEQKLADRGIKSTAVRLLIFKSMLEFSQAFSLSDLEAELGTVDKSTISRALKLFHEHLLIHSIDDGSGSIKYSVCNDNCQCTLNELHVHFNCTHCHKTYCLESILIPPMQLPDKFLLKDINFVMKGLCDLCSGM